MVFGQGRIGRNAFGSAGANDLPCPRGRDLRYDPGMPGRTRIDTDAIAARRLAVVLAAGTSFEHLRAAARNAWGRRLIELTAPTDWAHLPDAVALVVVCRDHPDRFREIASALRRRWPLAEILIVDGRWGVSAAHSRRFEDPVPPAMRANCEQAAQRLIAIAEGDPPRAWPWTMTRADLLQATG